ncbi:MAG TPA: DNA replication and repair protein RecF [Gemmatimonadaceae bacterium]|nr:DNA replication and repair protein RecF [Gemmatimonadaceae bacterium]
MTVLQSCAAVHLHRLSIRDFRNIAQAEVEAPRAGFVLVGDNGQGKTNLLEAIYYLHLFRSLRGARDAELARFGAAGFHVAAHVDGAAHDVVRAGFERASGRKRIVLDGVECARLSDALGALPCVAFAPSDVGIVAGPPALRRRFFDVALATTSRRYLLALQQYRHALAQRNAALRSAGASAVAGVWEAPLAQNGAVLRQERTAWVSWARPRLAELGAALGERHELSLRYRSAVDMADDAPEEEMRHALAQALQRHRARDVERGATHSGPHRDDLDLRLAGHAVRHFGSAGQQRTAAIALRLLECVWYRERMAREPVVLLDDPLAELDRDRAGRVLTLLTARELGQAVLAVPRPDDIPEAWTALARLRVREGVVTPWATPRAA